ncbi:HAD family hydrolase [Streptomyces sp. A1136]|uniref:HAD family hydrolase n=1 Tax=Streptomyces sp. A1136 TaxID=2563102 RepID=UPI00109E4AAA|nr:HAD family hydrolase [Streptomyces sp. A1136]THA47476.1 HAD family hydrolase [Streptomyces sp. A1136]
MTTALFDLDNTLIDRQEAVANWARTFAADHGFDPAAEAQVADALGERAYPATFVRLRDELGLAEPAAQLWNDYVQGIAANAKVRPNAIEGIEQLRATGWKVGILTNGAGDIQRAKLAAAGLADVVDAIAISEEIGARKPDLAAFHTALALCGSAQGAKAWMVGDNPQGDIGGAHQAGLRTIWLRGRTWPQHLAAAHHSVDTVTEAIEILLKEGNQ